MSVHGVLDTTEPAKAGAVKAEGLVLTGGADPYVTKAQVDALEREPFMERDPGVPAEGDEMGLAAADVSMSSRPR